MACSAIFTVYSSDGRYSIPFGEAANEANCSFPDAARLNSILYVGYEALAAGSEDGGTE